MFCTAAMCCQKTANPKTLWTYGNKDLINDETNAHVNIVFTELRNLKRFGVWQILNHEHLLKEQKNSLSKFAKPTEKRKLICRKDKDGKILDYKYCKANCYS